MMKKLFSLFLVLAMLCLPLALTACEDEGPATVEDKSERAEIYLTLYTITDEKTTQDAIERVQNAMNKILVDRYKTHIVLKCFTEDEYQAQLDQLYAAFAAEEAEELKRAAEEKEAEKKRKEEEKNLTSSEKRKLEEQRKREEEEAKAKAEEEEAARLERIKNGEEDPISGPQLDIFYLPTKEAYYTAAAEEKLVSLDTYLKVDFKEMYDYLSKNLLTNATVAYDEGDASLYGIPNNGVIAENGWYYVINTELVNKYGFKLNTAAPQMSEFAEYAAIIKAQEPGVIPIANPAPANNVDFYNDVAGFPIAVNNSEYGPFEGRGVLLTYSENSLIRNHFSYMADFRAAGYFIDRPTTANDNFFLDFRQGSAADVEQWKSEGYTVLTYRRPSTKIDLCRNGFYGISSFCDEDYQMRAMEVIQALYTNRDLHNLFAFGEADVDYTVNEDGVTVTRISDEYVMDFETTGNTLLGYLPAGYDVNYIQTAQAANRDARLSGFSSFCLVMDQDEQEWYDEILTLENECVAAYDRLCKGVSDWEQICNALDAKLEAVDLTGFVDDVITERYRSAAKKIREADKDNYTVNEVYYQSEYDALMSAGGKEEENGDK